MRPPTLDDVLAELRCIACGAIDCQVNVLLGQIQIRRRWLETEAMTCDCGYRMSMLRSGRRDLEILERHLRELWENNDEPELLWRHLQLVDACLEEVDAGKPVLWMRLGG